MDATAATAQPNTHAAPAERRQHKRIGVSWFASLRVGSSHFECLVIDLSLGGAKIAFAEPTPLPPGGTVGLVVEKFGTFRAEPMWQRGAFTGLRFREPPETIAAAFGRFLRAEN